MAINDALRIYLGADAQGGVQPVGMEERIREHYGASSTEVLKQVRHELDGLLEPAEASQLPSLQDIAALAARRARLRNPELHDDICRAIGNYVSYDYR